jgi:hypothetical protein
MDLYDARFLIESERRREEIALAARHLMVNEAQRAGMKIPPLFSLRNVNSSPIAMALAHSLDWLGHLFAVWSCRLQSRYASVPFGVSPENQSSPCSSY